MRENISLLQKAGNSAAESVHSGAKSHALVPISTAVIPIANQAAQKEHDMLMLKRLNYLRNSLENHNSRETTQHLRDLAERRRDERIMELWKSDLEKPSVYELVHKMKKA